MSNILYLGYQSNRTNDLKRKSVQNNNQNFRYARLTNKPKAKIAFGRALTATELPQYTSTVQKALKVLNKKVAVIIHGSSMPSAKGENTAFGSPFSKGAKNLTKFLKSNGVDYLQLGPSGKVVAKEPSPYLSGMNSKNTFFTDLKALTDKKWGNILSSKTFTSIVDNNPNKSKHYVHFDYTDKSYKTAIKEAYSNFAKNKDTNPELKELNKQFNSFKEKNTNWLERDSIYEVIANKKKNEGIGSYTAWKNKHSDLDKKLFTVLDSAKQDSNEFKMASARKTRIETKYAEDLDRYKFNQFIIDQQKKDTKDFLKKEGVKTIGDALVGYSDRDVWANENIFLKDLKMGVPGQAWGIPVVDPDKLFKKDGKLGEGGEFLKNKFGKIFEDNDGTRIDHIYGIYDPFVYTKTKMDNGATVPDDIKRLSTVKDSYKEAYHKILPDIVIPALNGKDKGNIVCENLGWAPDGFNQDFEKLNLSGISQLTWGNRGQSAPKNDWLVLGSHDTPPMGYSLNHGGDHPKDADYLNYLSGYLNPKDAKERAKVRSAIEKSNSEYGKEKYVELFTSPPEKVQMSFMDFFGGNEIYNNQKPGTANWSLRLDDDFKNVYYKNLEKNDPNHIPINMPETLEKAIKARKDLADVEHREGPKIENGLLESLDKYAKILREPEQSAEKIVQKENTNTQAVKNKTSNFWKYAPLAVATPILPAAYIANNNNKKTVKAN